MKIGGWPIDFGLYINADDIATLLRANSFSFSKYKLSNVSRKEFVSSTLESGLIGPHFTEKNFRRSFSIVGGEKLVLNTKKYDERLAQILAEYLRYKLLGASEKISFETVFSHRSKLDFMKEAESRGYKIYLYFVSTEDPAINIARVKEVRVPMGGHDVPEAQILGRYDKTMHLLFEAAQLAYQAYFFDNSKEPPSSQYFAHFKVVNNAKAWEIPDENLIPNWFYKYYRKHVKSK